jgi:hypothetical protein
MVHTGGSGAVAAVPSSRCRRHGAVVTVSVDDLGLGSWETSPTLIC